MREYCPSCDAPSIGNLIVQMETVGTQTKVYACVCDVCTTIYRSAEAEKNLGHKPIGKIE